MFSQLRQAVEVFAPQPRRGSVDNQEHEPHGHRHFSTSTQLADSAISNLRKSLATRSPGPQSLPRGTSLPDSELRSSKSNIEERLRAKFAIGDASNTTTPDLSGRASPASVVTQQRQHSLSPSSVPLPRSPVLRPQLETTTGLLESSLINGPEQSNILAPSNLVNALNLVQSEERYPEADIPLPDNSRPASPEADFHAISTPVCDGFTDTDVDVLQKRLKLVEQRFADVSMSFKRLQAEKSAADAILRELTPVEGITDARALRDYLQNLSLKIEMSQDETKRLTGKLTRQEERLEELRDTHRLETKSQSDQIERLRRQVAESEAVLSATQKSILERDDDYAKRLADIDRLQAEVERSNVLAKEEEEKRVKAISLLKTVRQKLVKAEKEKEDIIKDLGTTVEKERSEREREKSERIRLQQEVDTVNAERERTTVGLRTQFDKEIANIKEKAEKDVAAMKEQLDLNLVNLNSIHSKELATKNTHISTLEGSVNTLSNDKTTLFYQLQLRQAELESSQTHAENLQSQNTELQYQLREMADRLGLLQEELVEFRREQEIKKPDNVISAQEMAYLLSASETKYEAKIIDLRSIIGTMEKERNESEVEWSRRVREKTGEIDALKLLVDSSSKIGVQNDEAMETLREDNRRLGEELVLRLSEITALHSQIAQIKQAEEIAKDQLLKLDEKTAQIEEQLQESKARDAQLRMQNKAIREELRKVQSSAALLERQRSPGVGYWMAKSETNSSLNNPRPSISSSSSDPPSRMESPAPDHSDVATTDEDINLEYLRNVILQFLEHKEMRPNLEIDREGVELRTTLYDHVIEHFLLLAFMSLVDLTRNAFQSGLSPGKWIALCKLYRVQEAYGPVKDFEYSVSNSILVLCRSYPGNPGLRDYLENALKHRLISLPAFVVTLLQAARSTELHISATLDMLCKVAIKAHYSSGLPPKDSLVDSSDSPTALLEYIRDALNLLRVAHDLPMLPFHNLVASASELIILLLSCVSDLSQVSTAQALVHFADANGILQTLHLSEELRQVLQAFVVSLSLLIGDDVKVSRESQVMQSSYLAVGKGELVRPGSDNDIVTFSLLLHHLVRCRAKPFGAGSTSDAVVLLLATLRWTSWTPTVFYTQMLLSALTCLCQCSPLGRDAGSVVLWRSFIVGRVPRLLTAFESSVKADTINNPDWRAAMQFALGSVLRHTDLVTRSNHIASQNLPGSSDLQDGAWIFTRAVLQQCLVTGLIDRAFALSIDPEIANDNFVSLQSEAVEIGLDLESFLESRLAADTSLDTLRHLVERIMGEPGSHADFAEAMQKRFVALATALDLESFHGLCKLLYLDDHALDIISLHTRIFDLLFYALLFLDEYECDTVGDPQTAVSQLGDVVLFLQATMSRYHLTDDFISLGDRRLSASFLQSTPFLHSLDNLTREDTITFNTWFKALFDYNSDGIEDTMFRSTPPKTLMGLAATLFSHAIRAYSENKITSDVLTNGVTYFTSSLLNWTLVGVVQMLIKESEMSSLSSEIHLDILQTLLLSPDCPRPVLCICSPSVLKFVENRRGLAAKHFGPLLRQTTLKALGIEGDLHPAIPRVTVGVQSRIVIRDALAAARSANAVSLDVEHCLLVLSPVAFLHLLWSELSTTASQGKMEICQRVATFVLTIPRSSGVPLLPVFFHLVVPSLIAMIDRQQPPEQSMATELLVNVISSVLTASLHLEWAIHSITGATHHVLGQSSAGITRRFAAALRHRSLTGQAVVQRLGSSPSFIANFPTFAGELGM